MWSISWAVKKFNKVIPNLVVISYPLRSILKKDADWKWEKQHEKAYCMKKKKIEQVVELSFFERNKDIRNICDARRTRPRSNTSTIANG